MHKKSKSISKSKNVGPSLISKMISSSGEEEEEEEIDIGNSNIINKIDDNQEMKKNFTLSPNEGFK